MKVRARNGDTWVVRRRVTPWRRRLRGHIDVPDLGGGDDILGVIGLIIAIPFLVIAAVALSELLLLLLLIPLYVLVRIAFKRPWAVDVSRGEDHVATELVTGWRAAGERERHIAALIRGDGRYQPAVSAAPAPDPLTALRGVLFTAREEDAGRQVALTPAGRAALAHACVWDGDREMRVAAARGVVASDPRLAVQTYETLLQEARVAVKRPMTREHAASIGHVHRSVYAAALRLAVLDGN